MGSLASRLLAAAVIAAPPGLMRRRHFRRFIIPLVFLAAVLNYVDRQRLSALAPST